MRLTDGEGSDGKGSHPGYHLYDGVHMRVSEAQDVHVCDGEGPRESSAGHDMVRMQPGSQIPTQGLKSPIWVEDLAEWLHR